MVYSTRGASSQVGTRGSVAEGQQEKPLYRTYNVSYVQPVLRVTVHFDAR